LLNEGHEAWNKWCGVQGHNKSWVKVKLHDDEELMINGIGFKSANDVP
jgi:hypothetical protein